MVDLILTLVDFKTGTSITPKRGNKRNAKKILSNLGLSYVVGNYGSWYVAKSLENAQKLQQVFEVTRDIREQGRMSGYPESAVEASAKIMEEVTKPGKTEDEIVNILRTNEAQIPRWLANMDFMIFSRFRFSADNWGEELKTVMKWADAIREFDPTFYKLWIDWHHNRQARQVSLEQ